MWSRSCFARHADKGLGVPAQEAFELGRNLGHALAALYVGDAAHDDDRHLCEADSDGSSEPMVAVVEHMGAPLAARLVEDPGRRWAQVGA